MQCIMLCSVSCHAAQEKELHEASQELPVCRRLGARLHSSRAASAEPWLASSAISALGLASCWLNLARLAVSSLRARLMTASEGCCVNCNSALTYVPPFMTCRSQTGDDTAEEKAWSKWLTMMAMTWQTAANAMHVCLWMLLCVYVLDCLAMVTFNLVLMFSTNPGTCAQSSL